MKQNWDTVTRGAGGLDTMLILVSQLNPQINREDLQRDIKVSKREVSWAYPGQ